MAIKKGSKISKKEEETEIPCLRVKVKGYDSKLVDSSIKQILQILLSKGGRVKGPIPLPTEIKKITVCRSTFVHKDSREQFEMRIHKRFLDIINPTPLIIDSLQNLTLPSGVEIEIKTYYAQSPSK
jgi:small subunit ribosomal protein S10